MHDITSDRGEKRIRNRMHGKLATSNGQRCGKLLLEFGEPFVDGDIEERCRLGRMLRRGVKS